MVDERAGYVLAADGGRWPDPLWTDEIEARRREVVELWAVLVVDEVELEIVRRRLARERVERTERVERAVFWERVLRLGPDLVAAELERLRRVGRG